MKILIWKSKHDDLYYDASTPDKELDSFLKIFQEIENLGYYECSPPDDKLQKASYRRAKKGDKTATKDFIMMRGDYEYEDVSIRDVEE